MRSALSFLTLFVFVMGCDYSKQKDQPAAIALQSGASDVDWLMQKLFQPSCSRCHNVSSQAGGFKFDDASDLINPSRAGAIVPGDANSSLIYRVIANGSMPPRGPKPDASAMEVLSCWINKGASESSSSCTANLVPAAPVPPTDDSKTPVTPTPTPSPTPTPTSSPTPTPTPTPTSSPTPTPTPTPVVPQPPAVTFAELSKAVLEPHCVGCHNSDVPFGDVNLESKASILDGDEDIVSCGRSASSKLYEVVLKNEMPLGAPALSPDKKEIIRLWIDGDCR